MHLLITQIGPPYPPAAIGPLNHPNGDHLFLTPTVFTNFDKEKVRPFYTHGYLLQVAEGLDPVLKCLLMRCLADLPKDRPTLEELQEWIQSKEKMTYWNATDYTKEWCDKIFKDAPKVSPFDPLLVANLFGPPDLLILFGRQAPTSTENAHPSLATTRPETPPEPPVLSEEEGDPPTSNASSTSSDDDDGAGGVVLSGQAS